MERRIRALEQHARANGCSICREWDAPSKIEVVTEAEDRDNPLTPIPDNCPQCDRAIAKGIRRIVVPDFEEAVA